MQHDKQYGMYGPTDLYTDGKGIQPKRKFLEEDQIVFHPPFPSPAPPESEAPPLSFVYDKRQRSTRDRGRVYNTALKISDWYPKKGHD